MAAAVDMALCRTGRELRTRGQRLSDLMVERTSKLLELHFYLQNCGEEISITVDIGHQDLSHQATDTQETDAIRQLLGHFPLESIKVVKSPDRHFILYKPFVIESLV